MPPATDSIRRYPPAAQGWWAVAIFAIAAVLSYTDRQILGLLVDPIRADLHITDTDLSVLQGAAFAVLYSFVGLPLGRTADLVPRRALLIFAVTMWSFGTIMCGFSHSFAQLFGARLLVGIGEAALAPAAMSLIGDYFPSASRATPTGVFLMGMVAGSGVAISIGGYLLNAAQHAMFAGVPGIGTLAPWREVLVVLGIMGLILAPLLLTLYEPARGRSQAGEIRTRIFDLGDFPRVMREKYATLLPLYGAMAIGSIVDYAIIAWMPALLTRRFAYTPAEIAFGLGGVAIVAGLIGTPLGGILADFVSRRFGSLARIRLCGFILVAGILAAPIGLLASPAMMLASVLLWITISSIAGTIGIATLLDLLPHDARGLGTSTIAFCNTIVGLGLGPTLVALAEDHIYGTPTAIGSALSTVVAPAIAAASLLFFLSAYAARSRRLAAA